MKTVQLGRTGLEVSRLAMGGLFVSCVGAELDEGCRAVQKALDLGVNLIDTAPGYGNSEEVLGKALAPVEQPVLLSTKLGGRPQPFDPKNKDLLRQSVEESLRLLGRDHLDILMIHEPDRPGQYDWWDDLDSATGPVMELLDELKQEGVVRFTGLGGTTAYILPRLMRTGKFDVVLTAFNYSLLWREAEHAILPVAEETGMGVIVGSPLQQGALARKWEKAVYEDWSVLSPPRREQFQALYAFVDELGISLPELALRFTLSNPRVHCVLNGARSVDQVEENVRAAEAGPLPADVLARLDTIAAMVPFRPESEPFGLGWVLAAPENYTGPGAG